MRFLLIFLLGFVAACQSAVTPVADAGPDECGAGAYQGLVGQPEGSIDLQSFPAGTRIIHPDTMVTHDYRPDRLNVYIDEAGRVTSIRCG